MKKTILKLILLLFISSTITSCNSNDDDTGFTPTLPKITQTGENTFGCYVDGELLIPRSGEKNNELYSVNYQVVNNATIAYDEFIACDFIDVELATLIMHIDSMSLNAGEHTIEESNYRYAMNANPTVNILFTYKDRETGQQQYYGSIANTGTLTITKYDNENQIVSGLFNCTVVNRNDENDTKQITDGRFDFKINAINELQFP